MSQFQKTYFVVYRKQKSWDVGENWFYIFRCHLIDGNMKVREGNAYTVQAQERELQIP